jgi:Ni/Fe-hydrogenase subunit HybB-like protein
MNRRERITKTVLWTLVGMLAVVTIARFARGLGAVTNLSDAAPWGLWIAFDVMAGVALAAGGFTLAAAVYIFRLERYRRFTRPAILTAFLGYTAVAVGLLYDLGLPWHIWHPLIYPQPHSVLFEVAMCVMLYLTVLALEFAPVVLEHPWFDRPVFRTLHRLLKRVTIPLVIAGIMLSTLHQSSLGSLFLITPYRLHPLWYSPFIWLLFLVSAVAVGLMMVTLESYFSSWLFGHRLPRAELAGLGKAASVTLLVYAGLRLGDLVWRNALGPAFSISPAAALFWFELALSALVPGVLLALPAVRRSHRGLGLSALMVVLGVIGYRFDVSIVMFARPAGAAYFPSWMEVAVSAGVVSAAMLVFIFFVEHLRVYPEEHAASVPVAAAGFDPLGIRTFLPEVLAAPRRYSLAVVTGAAVAIGFLPGARALSGRPAPVPVSAPRQVEGVVTTFRATPGRRFAFVQTSAPAGADTRRMWLMVIDGDRDGRLVVFPHDLHEQELGGDRSCVTCHHANLPFQRNTACSACHRDMYSHTDLFDHAAHTTALGGNASCVRCHAARDRAKTRASATPCVDCHAGLAVPGSRVRPEAGLNGGATGYVDAMHELCEGCHQQRMKEEPARHPPDFALCRNCHRDIGDGVLERLAPYRPAAAARADARLGG